MISSPLRYPGGKAKLSLSLAEIIRSNSLFSKCYCEPYAGGAGLAIRLLSEGFVRSVKLNDIDKAIYSFWNSVFYESEKFCDLIKSCEISVAEWQRQREIYRNGAVSEIELGFAAFFLNRTSRSGIIEGSGPIGGYAQAGVWKIDARFNRAKQIDNIKMLSNLRDRVEITSVDALDFLDQFVDGDKNFIYLDPPYYVKGSKLYKNFYCHKDHVAIRNRLERSPNANWLVSYDDVPAIRQIYAPREPISYRLNYSAGATAKGSEVMFASDALTIGDVPIGLAA